MQRRQAAGQYTALTFASHRYSMTARATGRGSLAYELPGYNSALPFFGNTQLHKLCTYVVKSLVRGGE